MTSERETARASAPYLQRMLEELRAIELDYTEILGDSEIYYHDPNARGSGVIFVGAAIHHWSPSSPELAGRIMRLLGRLRDWEPRFRLLFPHPTPSVEKVLDQRMRHLESWLTRKGGNDHSLPATVEQAIERMRADVEELAGLATMLPADIWSHRLVFDTNALIDEPDVAAYSARFPHGYLVHLLPVVLREIDDLKRSGRTLELREAATKANRRLKGIRINAGVGPEIRVQGRVYLFFEHVEPRGDSLPEWLDLTVPDDRFVAPTLLVQSQHPGSAVFAVTGDVNLQTKLAAAGLPFIDPDSAPDGA